MPPGRRPRLSPDVEERLSRRLTHAKIVRDWAVQRSEDELAIEVYEANQAGMPYAAIGLVLGVPREAARLLGVAGEQARGRCCERGPVGPGDGGEAD